MGQLARFVVFGFGILIPPYLYLGWSLATENALLWVALAIPFLSILTMPLLVFSLDRAREIWWRDVALHFAYFSMGLTTYFATFALLRDGLRWGSVVDLERYWVLVATAGAMIGGALMAFSGPRIKRVTVRIENLPSALRGLKIVQITDLHIGNTTRGKYVERVVRLANGLAPDLVALTGDIADGDCTRVRAHARALGELEPKERVFYVPGNHEYYWNISDWLYEFKRLGATLLMNEGVKIPRAGGDVWVGGITDPQARSFGGPEPDVEKAFAGGAADCAFKLLLSHRPNFARRAGEVGFDLQLSGHTHGGQFFPWTVVVMFVHEFAQGLKRAGRAWIYVSPGTGTWGPLLRLGTTPELTLLTIESASAQ